MPELTLKKIPFTAESDNRLRMLKARTGLDRNYLCRMGFCLSLEEPGIPALPDEEVPDSREIDRYTLLGQHGQAYVALLLVWMKERQVRTSGATDVNAALVAHMNRGVEIIAARVRSLADMITLLPHRQPVASRTAAAK